MQELMGSGDSEWPVVRGEWLGAAGRGAGVVVAAGLAGLGELGRKEGGGAAGNAYLTATDTYVY